MRKGRWLLVFGGAGSLIIAAAMYLWVTGIFLPEPIIVLPDLPSIEERRAMVSAGPSPAPAPSPALTPTSPPAVQPSPISTTSPSSMSSPVPAPAPSPVAPRPDEVSSNSTPTNQPTLPNSLVDPRIAQVDAIFRPSFLSLQSQCEGQLDRLADAAVVEYQAAGKTAQAKATIGAKYLPLAQKLQTTCERHFQSLISALEAEFRIHSLPLTLVDEAKRAYDERVVEMRSILAKRAGL